MLIEQVKLAQQSNEAISELILKFNPLLRKYAHLLEGGEDSYSDMVLFFLELIPKIDCEKMQIAGDGALVRYIEKAVRNHYILLSKRTCRQSDHEIELSDPLCHKLLKEDSDYSILSLLDELSPFEKMVVEKIVLQGYSAAVIAREQDCTRQHINQVKKRALEKLKNAIT